MTGSDSGDLPLWEREGKKHQELHLWKCIISYCDLVYAVVCLFFKWPSVAFLPLACCHMEMWQWQLWISRHLKRWHFPVLLSADHTYSSQSGLLCTVLISVLCRQNRCTIDFSLSSNFSSYFCMSRNVWFVAFFSGLQCVSYNEWYTTRIIRQLPPFCCDLNEQAATGIVFWSVNAIITVYSCMMF